MLTGIEQDTESEEESLYEVSEKSIPEKKVEYKPDFPIETFDFIITDECHRSIYNQWRQGILFKKATFFVKRLIFRDRLSVENSGSPF